LQTTPPKLKSTHRRSRKHSSGVSPNSSDPTGSSLNNNNNNNNNTDASFSIDMDDIFATVLSNIKDKQVCEREEVTKVAVGGEDLKRQVLENNGVVPICVSLRTMQTPTVSFENEEPTTGGLLNVRENSHLLQFDRCLLGCVFLIQPSEAYYTPDW